VCDARRTRSSRIPAAENLPAPEIRAASTQRMQRVATADHRTCGVLQLVEPHATTGSCHICGRYRLNKHGGHCTQSAAATSELVPVLKCTSCHTAFSLNCVRTHRPHLHDGAECPLCSGACCCTGTAHRGGRVVAAARHTLRTVCAEEHKHCNRYAKRKSTKRRRTVASPAAGFSPPQAVSDLRPAVTALARKSSGAHSSTQAASISRDVHSVGVVTGFDPYDYDLAVLQRMHTSRY